MKDLSVKEIMTSELVTLGPDDSLTNVVEVFKKKNFHHLPIVSEQGKLEGIISLTDLERMKVGATFFRNPKKESYMKALFQTIRACEVMTKDVIELQPTDSIEKAYQIFSNNKFRALPVVGKGKLVGILTPLDILDYFFKESA